ncbi:MAG: response regulator [Magnetococcales bacterium]|nr:response regulator [Magnetococcales bacterium]MBF0149029.1 response regulator [Magnetococcales bacterium]MBF0172078.1 response regulator [Magnetococcales bacterium]MBF0346190.1 response regulator [Magnetococcales bacterium]MBF0630317.1 response regulator [Magnetococcales bacterium]
MSRILIIDDDPAIREISSRILGRAGHVLELVKSAEEGLERCAQVRFDLVITDLTLPGMNGVKFSELLLQQHPHTRILIFSGLLTAPDASTTQWASASLGLRFLAKPFRPKELLSAVEAVLVEDGTCH